MKALVTGGTGYVGTHLIERLQNPAIAGRSLEKILERFPGSDARQWNPTTPLDNGLLSGIDTVFHLAGESIFHGRWNAAKKERIRRSRIGSTRQLVDLIGKSTDRPRTLITASAVGIYGSRGSEELTEDSPAGDDFLADVCRRWEDEAIRAEEFGVRVVTVRTGVVLGRNGGALASMLLPFRMGLGGRLGNGRQFMAWIHLDDLVGILLSAAENEALRGPLNAVSPSPVSNRQFTRALAGVLHRPAIFPLPAALLHLALGEFASVLLASQKVIPSRLLESGYSFAFADIDKALEDLVG